MKLWMKNRKKFLIQVLSPIAVMVFALILLLVSWRFSGFATWYANNVYPLVVHTFGRFFNLFPFSVFELGLVMIPLSILLFLVCCIICVISAFRPKRREKLANNSSEAELIVSSKHGFPFFGLFDVTIKRTLKVAGFTLLYFLSFLFTFFVLNAGINYNRESFAFHAGIEVRDSEIDELKALYRILVYRAHILSELVSTDSYGVFVPSNNDFHSQAVIAMRNLNELHGGLVGFLPKPRAPVMSRLMSHMRIGGFFSPWTLEAHYNGEMPPHRKPFMMVHELAHVSGHMREDEANFIAYLASRNSSCVDFNYSAVYDGIIYVLNALHRVVSRETYAELFGELPMQIRRDMAANRAFWQQFDGPVAEMANRANDAYLRANRQEDGVMSYGRMVDLMLAYYRTNSMLKSFTFTTGFRNP